MGFILTVFAILMAVSVHEAAHAWMADRLGDPTGRFQGRITLNPLKHLDFFGTLALVFFGFGWGKPVEFNPANLSHPKRDSALIAVSGPISNLLCAILSAIPLKYLSATSLAGSAGGAATDLLSRFFIFNIVLFALNVLPFPPLDGSKFVGIFVPDRYRRAYENYLHSGVTYFILFVLFDMFVVERVYGESILRVVLGTITEAVVTLISLGT